MKRICTEVDGKEVCGHVQITGTRILRFTVYYDGREKSDAKDYNPEQEGYLMTMANQILYEMATSNV